MKHAVLSIAVCLLFLISSTQAQPSNPAADASAVRATVQNYIEAYYHADGPRMQQTLDPHYLKHIIHRDNSMTERNGSQMIEDTSTATPANLPSKADQTEQISVLDIVGDIASAKLVTPGWTDYLTLSKSNGQWKIVSVVQRITASLVFPK